MRIIILLSVFLIVLSSGCTYQYNFNIKETSFENNEKLKKLPEKNKVMIIKKNGDKHFGYNTFIKNDSLYWTEYKTKLDKRILISEVQEIKFADHKKGAFAGLLIGVGVSGYFFYQGLGTMEGLYIMPGALVSTFSFLGFITGSEVKYNFTSEADSLKNEKNIIENNDKMRQ